MPPKAKITPERILDAAFELIREQGVEAVNARALSEKLGCSTQPILYHFQSMEELKGAVYQKADEYHSAYLMALGGGNPMLEIGLRYIQFGAEEKKLFRFLFQSNGFSGKPISELIEAEELQPILAILSQAAQISPQQAKTMFRSLFLIAHGYASMFANNEVAYDELTISSDLELVFDGALSVIKGGR